jgi:hypothetical protein
VHLSENKVILVLARTAVLGSKNIGSEDTRPSNAVLVPFEAGRDLNILGSDLKVPEHRTLSVRRAAIHCPIGQSPSGNS